MFRRSERPVSSRVLPEADGRNALPEFPSHINAPVPQACFQVADCDRLLTRYDSCFHIRVLTISS